MPPHSFDAPPAPSPGPAALLLTANLAPVSCGFRERPEDFEVEELPAYEPAGEGEHLYLFVEKRDLTTAEAVRRLAGALGRPASAVGAAGRKDRRALARQWLSIEGVEPERARGLALDGLRVLRAERHPHKLRIGKLRGNRFRLRLARVAAGDRPRLEEVLARVVERGLPNAFGPQRFGADGRGAELGRLLAKRRWREYLAALASPPDALDRPELAALRAALESGSRSALARLGKSPAALGRELAAAARQLARRPGEPFAAVRAAGRALPELHLSALQAEVFNRVLARRLASGGALAFDRLAPGDFAWLHERGAVFLVERPEELEPRRRAFELSPSGPVAGHRMSRAQGAPGAIEDEALAAAGVALADFRGLGLGHGQRGARRPLRVRPAALTLDYEGEDALLGFELPPGSYATALVAEIRKDAGGGE